VTENGHLSPLQSCTQQTTQSIKEQKNTDQHPKLELNADMCPCSDLSPETEGLWSNISSTLLCVSFSEFCFSDVRTTEIKLQLNNAAGGWLRRNKILFYFRRLKHIAETETKTLKQPETVFSVRTSWKWSITKLSTVGWNEAPNISSFVLFRFYLMMCDGLYRCSMH